MPLAHHRPPPELLKKLGENVRRLRRAKDYTQEELAELIDVHPRMVQKIEFGETNILATTAMRLRAALECSWDDLMPVVSLKEMLSKAPTDKKPSSVKKISRQILPQVNPTDFTFLHGASEPTNKDTQLSVKSSTAIVPVIADKGSPKPKS